MGVLNKLQWGSGLFPSCITAPRKQKCQNMKCLCKRPALCTTAEHPGTGHFTVFITQWKDTTWMAGSPPPSSTPLVWGALTPCCLIMLCFRGKSVTVTPHSEPLTLIRFRSLNVPPSPVARRLCASSLHFPWMKPGVQTIDLVFFWLVLSSTLLNIFTVTISVS